MLQENTYNILITRAQMRKAENNTCVWSDTIITHREYIHYPKMGTQCSYTILIIGHTHKPIINVQTAEGILKANTLSHTMFRAAGTLTWIQSTRVCIQTQCTCEPPEITGSKSRVWLKMREAATMCGFILYVAEQKRKRFGRHAFARIGFCAGTLHTYSYVQVYAIHVCICLCASVCLLLYAFAHVLT